MTLDVHRTPVLTDPISAQPATPTEPARGPLRYDNRITLQKLEVFCAVVDLGGVSRAADHLWVAQSVVSGHLRSLQDRLGVQVLYRDGQQMKLTEAGEEAYHWATETLAGTRELMRTLDDLDGASGGTLAITASLSLGSYVLPPILAEFRRERPRATITMDVCDPELAFGAVESGTCDVGIVVAETGHEHPRVRCEVLGQEEMVLVVAPEDLPGVKVLALAELSELDLVAAPLGHVGRQLIDSQLVAQGASPQNVVMELGHPEAMKRMIRSGTGAGLLFRSCVEEELHRGTLREIQLTGAELSLTVLSVTRPDRRPRSIQAQVMEHIRAGLADR